MDPALWLQVPFPKKYQKLARASVFSHVYGSIRGMEFDPVSLHVRKGYVDVLFSRNGVCYRVKLPDPIDIREFEKRLLALDSLITP